MGRSLGGNVFILILLSVVSSIYYTFIIRLYYPLTKDPENGSSASLVVLIFHIILFMFAWCFIYAVISDPGKVPPYWGFYLGDPEYRRRRYCLICHVFKPERCHHCSVCNRCVLNMDHHCPWINNCIGFYNRKVFVLLLLYSLLILYYILICMLPQVIDSLKYLWYNQSHQDMEVHLLYIGIYVQVCFMSVVLTSFTKFHAKLILTNITTIENLDKENNPDEKYYDIGRVNNWLQVFGKNYWLWPFPYYGKSGRPYGDGVQWSLREEIYDPPSDNESNNSSNPFSLPRNRVMDPIQPNPVQSMSGLNAMNYQVLEEQG